MVVALLKGKARRDINRSTRSSRETPLYCAVKHGHADVALVLVRAGGDVDAVDANGWSPLMRATVDGRADVVNNLLLSGALANARNNKGSRPLHYAAAHGHLDVIKLLLKAGASPGLRRKVNRQTVGAGLGGEGGERKVNAQCRAAR